MSVLVIGGGFLGGSIATGLDAAGVPVRLLSRRASTPRTGAALTTVEGDASDPAVLELALSGVTDVVFCAGSALPAEAELDAATARLQDLGPLRTVVHALQRASAPRLRYLSSGGTIYGEPDVLPVPETHPLRPKSTYGMLKAEAESMLADLRRERDAGATALRCANVYGPTQRPWRSQGMIATLVAAAGSREIVPLYGDGLAIRDHVWVGDISNTVAALIGRDDLPPAINVGSGVGTTLDGLVDRVAHATGSAIQVSYRPPRPTDLHTVLLDITLLRSLTGFEPTSLDHGLRRLVEATVGPIDGR